MTLVCTILYWTTLHWPTCKVLSIVGSVVSAFNPLMSCLKSSLLECLSEPATPITILILQSVLQLPKHVSSLVGLFFLAGHFFLIFFKALSTSLLRLAALMFFGTGNAGKTVCVAKACKNIYITNPAHMLSIVDSSQNKGPLLKNWRFISSLTYLAETITNLV